MRYTSVLFLAALALATAFQTDKKMTKVVFFGDSITEAGVQPGGYISLMRNHLQANPRGGEYELLGAGIGGNKVYDLYLRLEKDVLAHTPDVTFIFVGVNDVWHKRSFSTGTDADKFEGFYAALIEKMQGKGIRCVLVTPACIGEKTDCTNSLDGELNQYANIIRRLATQYRCDLVDLRQAFLAYNIAHNPDNKESGILTTDGVHLNAEGNALVAEKMLEKL
jgi:lysophospholipase L1-like esterase